MFMFVSMSEEKKIINKYYRSRRKRGNEQRKKKGKERKPQKNKR